MFILIRAVTYSVLFVGFLLVFLPVRVLSRSGIARPEEFGLVQLLGATVAVAGSVIAAWCIVTFITVGRGTPAPFDPPRRLVTAGPYGYVRNPMYIGAALALAGAATFYGSWQLLGYAAVFLLVMHLFVVLHEESALSSTFGAAYDGYRLSVRRWLPTARGTRHRGFPEFTA